MHDPNTRTTDQLPNDERVSVTIDLPGMRINGSVDASGAETLKANATRLAAASGKPEGRPTPTPNVEGQPADPNPEHKPATPNPEHKPVTPNTPPPIPGRGAVTQRLRREKQTRHHFAQRRYPGISAKDAEKVCIVRLDFQEKVYGKRGKVRGEAGDA